MNLQYQEETSIHNNVKQVQEIWRLIEQADGVLIGAGAGLSAEAGIDYNDANRFARMFPALVKQGLKSNYDVIGYEGWASVAARWAYYALTVQHDFYEIEEHPVYQQLLEIIKQKDYFVFTSNVDGLFYRNHYHANRIFTPQGNYSRLQCLTPCTPKTWSIEPYLEKMLPNIHPGNQVVKDESLLPTCPQCGGEMTLNVRSGYWFVEDQYHYQQKLFDHWVKKMSHQKLVVLEFGVGFNTPSVIRWPLEKIVSENVNSYLVRVNLEYPGVPESINDRSISIPGRISSLIEQLYKINTKRMIKF